MAMKIKRELEDKLKELAGRYPVVTITGPRQSGKTTLVKMAFPRLPYLSLEDPDIRELAEADPRAFLSQHPKGMILDEIQKVPNLLSYIQGKVDIRNKPGQYVLTGSQQFELAEKVNQSLAGRTALLRLLPLTMDEIAKFKPKIPLDSLILHGAYPRIYAQRLNPTEVYKNYFDTYIQRDLRQIVNIKDLRLFRKFVRLCAGRTGQIFVASHLANAVGVSITTIDAWISILEASYIIFLLEPYYENISKRLIKSPKLYFYDVGVASYLLGLENSQQMERDPLRGSLVENLVILELIKKRFNQGQDHNLFFYQDSHHNEVDVIIKTHEGLIPVEIKAAQTYNNEFLKGLHSFKKVFSRKTLGGFIIYAGAAEQAIHDFTLLNYRNTRKVLPKS